MGTLAFAGGNSSDGYHTGVDTPSPLSYRNIEPRLGLAYAVGHNTVIRASYEPHIRPRRLDQRQPIRNAQHRWARARSNRASQRQQCTSVLLG